MKQISVHFNRLSSLYDIEEVPIEQIDYTLPILQQQGWDVVKGHAVYRGFEFRLNSEIKDWREKDGKLQVRSQD